jgi:hypothetical protein
MAGRTVGNLAFVLFVSAALSGSANAAYPPTLENLSFENGLNSWDVTNYDNIAISATPLSTATANGITVAPTYGNSMVQLTSTDIGSLVLKQTYYGADALATVPVSSAITIWYRMITQDYTSANHDFLSVLWKDSNQTWDGMSLTSNTLGSTGDSGWLSISVPANSAKGIYFRYDSDLPSQSWAFVDIANPVPEPGEWAMILATFGLVALVVRRRRELPTSPV